MSRLSRLTTRLLAGLLVLAAALLGPGASRAFAAEQVGSYAVAGTVNTDGSLAVEATITFDGTAPATLTQRFATTREVIGDREYQFTLNDIKATVNGTPIDTTVTSEPGYTVVTMATQGVTAPVVLSYTVIGATIAEDTGETTLTWRLLQGLSLPVREFTATLKVSTAIKLVYCAAGPPSSPGVCVSWGGGTHDYPNPTFTDGPRGAGEIVEATIRFPAGAVSANEQVRELWTLGRAFSTGPLQLGLALGLLALGGIAFWLLHRKIGRDSIGESTEPTLVADFHPVAEGQAEFRVRDGIRPGQVGTLVDERVDPVDVTASLIDLAIRGHLLITEQPHAKFATGEWTFTRRESGDALRPYEQTLLDAVAPAGGAPVALSQLPEAIGAVIGNVQNQLYDDVVSLGWFARRPDQTRNTWLRLGLGLFVAAVLATILLAAFTSFGLVGLAAIAVALLVIFLGQEMPARTPQGVSLLNGLGLLRAQLLGHPTDQMPKGQELRELSEVLPYAVVLGGYDRWVKALVAADDDDEAADSTDLDWYHAPDDWHLADLPDSLDRLITTMQGRLFAR